MNGEWNKMVDAIEGHPDAKAKLYNRYYVKEGKLYQTAQTKFEDWVGFKMHRLSIWVNGEKCPTYYMKDDMWYKREPTKPILKRLFRKLASFLSPDPKNS